ncbi:DJ-1/PfpI family protein [Streptomyces aureoversilis]|uniref:DJ-1/PfpI family protein n=1 Tax=Streptomyces aureoversilis TaxID=67277 RepID=A0ABV9ZZD7_9ACTN
MLGAGRGLETVTGRLDTLIVVGGVGFEEASADEPLPAQVRRLAERSRRVASVCTGTYVLAAAWQVDHRRVTTHWGYGEQLAARRPAGAGPRRLPRRASGRGPAPRHAGSPGGCGHPASDAAVHRAPRHDAGPGGARGPHGGAPRIWCGRAACHWPP